MVDRVYVPERVRCLMVMGPRGSAPLMDSIPLYDLNLGVEADAREKSHATEYSSRECGPSNMSTLLGTMLHGATSLMACKPDDLDYPKVSRLPWLLIPQSTCHACSRSTHGLKHVYVRLA